MYMSEVYKRMPGGADEIESLTREIELCRDAGGDDDYENYLAEYVAATIYTEIEVTFVTYKQSKHFHCFVVTTEGGNTEKNHAESKYSFWHAMQYAIRRLGAAKIEPDQEWD